MTGHKSISVEDASACFDSLILFADVRDDHLLAALLTDAWSHFQVAHSLGTGEDHGAT